MVYLDHIKENKKYGKDDLKFINSSFSYVIKERQKINLEERGTGGPFQ